MVAKLNGVNIDVEAKLPFIKKIAENFDNLIALWLFGSYAKGNQTPLSDIDIAYLSIDGLEASLVGAGCVAHCRSPLRIDLDKLSIPSISAIRIVAITQKTKLMKSSSVGETGLSSLWTIWNKLLQEVSSIKPGMDKYQRKIGEAIDLAIDALEKVVKGYE